MKIKIISDGLARSTKIINLETGEVLNNVTSVTWTCDTKDKQLSEAILKIIDVPVEITIRAEDRVIEET